MRKFLIEREIPAIGSADPRELGAIVETFNNVLHDLRPQVQWVQSYVAADKTFCVYLARDMDTLRRYVEKSGFPADKITEVNAVIDPATSGDT
jgi:hypothetical protein